MNEIGQSRQKAIRTAREGIRLIEKNGLTLYEALSVPELMKNYIENGLREDKTPYKCPFEWETPTT